MVSLTRIVLGLVMSFALFTAAFGAEERTINAFSVWNGQGTVYMTGVKSATFVGALSGPLFVETDKGPAESGWIDCLGTIEIDLTSAKQAGNGKCTITAPDGARAFADWKCSGVHLIGCKGDLSFTEGTERFAGITGGGSMLVRSSLVKLVENLMAGKVEETASGIAVWRDLSYKLP